MSSRGMGEKLLEADHLMKKANKVGSPICCNCIDHDTCTAYIIATVFTCITTHVDVPS